MPPMGRGGGVGPGFGFQHLSTEPYLFYSTSD